MEDRFSFRALFYGWLSAGLANGLTSGILNPFDVIKTRMQSELLSLSRSSTPAIGSRLFKRAKVAKDVQILKPSFRSVFYICLRERGVIGLWTPGLSATILRELTNSGPRAGLYVPLRNILYGHYAFLNDQNDRLGNKSTGTGMSQFLCKVGAALTTGALGAILSNPVDVVKVRLMLHRDAYPNTLHAMSAIYQMEGIQGLYRGVWPSTLRAMFIAVGELATYDQAKQELKYYFATSPTSKAQQDSQKSSHKVDRTLATRRQPEPEQSGIQPEQEHWGLHVAASLITGVTAATVAAPFDIVKTRLMSAQAEAVVASTGSSSSSTGSSSSTFSSSHGGGCSSAGMSASSTGTATDVVYSMLRKEGVLVFFRGWLPSYLRLGPHALICFPILEQLRLIMGLEYI